MSNWSLLGRIVLYLGGIAMMIFSIIIIALGGALDGVPMLGIGILLIVCSAILGKLERIQFTIDSTDEEQKENSKE